MVATSVKLYSELYEACDNAPLYAAPWWLNATCGPGGWDAIPLSDEDGLTSVMIPFYKTLIRGLSAVITAPMTQWLPVLKTDHSPVYPIAAFLQSLPECSILDLTMKPGKNPILPGPSFHVNFKYSYIIPHHEEHNHFKLNYNEGLRRNLREAEKNYAIAASDDIQTFLRLCQSSYHLRKMNPPSWLLYIVPVVVDALKEYRSGMINMVFHRGVAIAGILTGWDKDTTYYLSGGRHNDEQGAHAHALLLDHAISEAQQKGHKFDFEGSMHPGIANFFHSFGAAPESYWQIRKFRGMGKLWSLFH